MAIIPQFFKDSVVAIGTIDKRWIATGFIVARKNENGGYNTFLVTNKHVFEDKNGKPKLSDVTIRFNLINKIDAKDYLIKLIDSHEIKQYSVHPNPSTDVACKLINPTVLEKDLGGLSAFVFENSISLTQNEMLQNGITEGSIVYMLGFPSGIVGLNSKVPLCRMGCISNISEPNGNNSFFVDIQNFPGSSGSPIINRPELVSLKGTNSYERTSLVGIISAYVPYEDSLVSLQTGKVMQKLSENSGIAIAYNVDSIRETVEIEFQRVSNKKVILPNKENPKVEGN